MTTGTGRILTLAGVVLALGSAPVSVAAQQLPPEVLAPLEADRAAAQRDLVQARRRVAAAATAQRTGAAVAARATSQRRLLEGIAALVGAELPGEIAAAVRSAEAPATARLERLEANLERVTDEAADAQAEVLDADRRLRALQRAAATEDDRDTSLGSWRFGSGGPPVSAGSIDDYLASKASPLAGQGVAFLEAGVEHEIDPRLIVAIAGAESYFGITTCAPFNAWGWGCPNSPFSFTSWAHAIDTVTLGLREGYVDDGLTSVGEIHLRYAPPNAANDPTGLNYAWPDNVARFLVEQGGDPQDIEGVLGPSR